MTRQQRLGRGLAALIGDDYSEDEMVHDAKTMRHVPIEFLRRNPNNPRKNFAVQDLKDLSNSVREKGLLQPIIVRPVEAEGENDDAYEIVAGERRWRAAQQAGVHEVPIIIRELSDGEAFEIALIENIQRADLDPIEEAQGYKQLIERFEYTQDQMAETLAKSRSHIANTLRLLKLPESIQQSLRTGDLTAGHARALVNADNPEEIADRIIKLGLNVRDAENLARKGGGRARPKTSQKEKDPNITALERQISEVLGLKVEIASSGEAGQLRIFYKSLEQLDDVCFRLSRQPGQVERS
ncbi:MAG: ParB/RepB/Spo0J family partition protein [Hyphomicrobiales bacterium]